ncbi:hypothetical protein ACVWZL_001320 [Bradyrhizobium sp. GM2.4]
MMRPPEEHDVGGGERYTRCDDDKEATWVAIRLALVAGIALGFGWGVTVALGRGPIGKWLRGEL